MVWKGEGRSVWGQWAVTCKVRSRAEQWEEGWRGRQGSLLMVFSHNKSNSLLGTKWWSLQVSHSLAILASRNPHLVSRVCLLKGSATGAENIVLPNSSGPKYSHRRGDLCTCLGDNVESGPMTVGRSYVSRATMVPRGGGCWVPVVSWARTLRVRTL